MFRTTLPSRLDPIRAVLAASGADAFLVERPEDSFYLTRFPSSYLLVLIMKKKAWLVTDSRYALAIRQRRDLSREYGLVVRQGPLEPLLGEILKRGRVRVLGFDPAFTSVRRLAELRRGLPGIRLKPVPDLVARERLCKTPDELDLIRKSLAVTEKSFLGVLERIRPGVSEAAIRTELEYLMAQNGAEKPAFDTIIASGPNAAVPHHRTGSRKVRRGEMVLLDFGAVVNGYHSDLSRTVFIGRPDALYRERYQAVREAMEEAEKRMKAGMSCAAADGLARKVLAEKKLGKYFTHSLGHGVGVEIHEAPSLNPRSKEILKKNMVVTVEPGVYIAGWGGIRIEDMVVAGEKESRVLNALSRDIWRV